MPTNSIFWKNGPVVQLDSKEEIKPNESIKKLHELKHPLQFKTCDITDNKIIIQIHNLLLNNYVEDKDSSFRLNYSIDFLKWVLTPPGYNKDFYVGIENVISGELVGFISGIPFKCFFQKEKNKMLEINFLCINKELRGLNLAPELIKEITRRGNNYNIVNAIYTGGKRIHLPLAETNYYHRLINIKKLMEVGFTSLKNRWTMKMTLKYYNIDETKLSKKIRLLTEKDINQIQNLFSDFYKKYEIYPCFNEEEISHWLLPKHEIIYTYVFENDNHIITDFISFFLINTSVLNNSRHKNLKIAYGFYYINTKLTINEIVNQAVILSKKLGCDVFNCLDILENKTFFDDLRFVKGTGILYYFLYNIKYSTIEPSKIGLILH